MYVGICIYIYVCIYVCMYISIDKCIHICILVYTYTHIFMYMCKGIYGCFVLGSGLSGSGSWQDGSWGFWGRYPGEEEQGLRVQAVEGGPGTAAA